MFLFFQYNIIYIIYQVPSHYAPNYPMGHVRRERGAGYSTLPMPQSGHHTLPHPNSSGSPQIGMVHPIPQHTQSTPPMPISSVVSANSNDLNMPRMIFSIYLI